MEKHELTPNEIKGVDLVVKSLMKKYNFIIGWEPDETYMNYDYTLYINLKVDYDMVSDYFGIRIRPTIKKGLKEKDPYWWGSNLYSPTAALDEPNGYNGGYELKKKMNNLSRFLYKELPPQLQRTYVSHIGEVDYPTTLTINGFNIY